jgi:hypothetical protein
MKTSAYNYKDQQFREIHVETDAPQSIDGLRKLAAQIQGKHFFFKCKPGAIGLYAEAMKQWLETAEQHNIQFSYADYDQSHGESSQTIPTIAYTEGSIRDDFNFGALVLISTKLFRAFLDETEENDNYAGWYRFRLYASRKTTIHHHAAVCYSYSEQDLRKTGEQQFDYVDPKNRARQLEMEAVATDHLTQIGARLYAPFQSVNFEEEAFPVEASVIIPVLNRELTIAEAIQSVIKQQCTFPFNLIVVNNHSTDRTAEIIDHLADERLIQLIPESRDLGIGGCWNEGIHHPACGRFAIQLDSDDLYLNEHTLQKIVDKFREEKCAMVIGSYQMVNFKLEEIPPGVIDHREWTHDNGPNNALRINGLGAPRAFYTPIIRQIGFPNVSYGEDYAVALAISRTWKIGRIYEPIYLCRRWDDNTDANLSIAKVNAHNAYKDSLRTNEIAERKKSVVIKSFGKSA